MIGLAIATTIFENKLHNTVNYTALRSETKTAVLASPLVMWDNSGLLSERNLRFMQETYADAIHNVWWLCLAMALCCGYAAMAMRNLNLDDSQDDGQPSVAASCAASVYTTEVRSPFEKEDARSLIRYSAPPGSFKPGKPASQRSSVQRSSIQRSSIQPSVQRSSLQPSVARSSMQRSSLRSGSRRASPPPPVPPLPDMSSLSSAAAKTPSTVNSALPWGQQASSTPRASPVPPSPIPPSPVPPSPVARSPVPPSPAPSTPKSLPLPFPEMPEPVYMTPKTMSSQEAEELPSADDSSMALPDVRSFTPLDTNKILSLHESLHGDYSPNGSTERLRMSDRYPDVSPRTSFERASVERFERPSLETLERPSLEGRALPPIPTPTSSTTSLSSGTVTGPRPLPSATPDSAAAASSSTTSLASASVGSPRPSPATSRSVGGPRPLAGPRPLPKSPLPPVPTQSGRPSIDQTKAESRASNMV